MRYRKARIARTRSWALDWGVRSRRPLTQYWQPQVYGRVRPETTAWMISVLTGAGLRSLSIRESLNPNARVRVHNQVIEPVRNVSEIVVADGNKNECTWVCSDRPFDRAPSLPRLAPTPVQSRFLGNQVDEIAAPNGHGDQVSSIKPTGTRRDRETSQAPPVSESHTGLGHPPCGQKPVGWFARIGPAFWR